MKTAQPTKRRRYPVPLLYAAERLDVSYTHLWLVMNERRVSLRLMKRYNELVASEAQSWGGALK